MKLAEFPDGDGWIAVNPLQVTYIVPCESKIRVEFDRGGYVDIEGSYEQVRDKLNEALANVIQLQAVAAQRAMGSPVVLPGLRGPAR